MFEDDEERFGLANGLLFVSLSYPLSISIKGDFLILSCGFPRLGGNRSLRFTSVLRFRSLLL